MTDYNDGKWHGWNGGECPVDPKSEVEWIWHDPAQNTAGKSEGLASRAAWRSHVLKFRVTKPAPPKPREWWLTDTGDDVWDSESSAADWVSKYPEDGPVIHVREVLPSTPTQGD